MLAKNRSEQGSNLREAVIPEEQWQIWSVHPVYQTGTDFGEMQGFWDELQQVPACILMEMTYSGAEAKQLPCSAAVPPMNRADAR